MGLMGERSNIVDFKRSGVPPAAPPARNKNGRGAKPKAARRLAKQRREIEKDEQRIDADLNRALDAIALLAQNEVDPIVLIHRLSSMGKVEITGNIVKLLEWLLRFANQWQSYVQSGIIQAQNAAPGDEGQPRARGLYLIPGDNHGG